MKKAPKPETCNILQLAKPKLISESELESQETSALPKKVEIQEKRGSDERGGGVAAELWPLMSGAIRQKSWKGRYN